MSIRAAISFNCRAVLISAHKASLTNSESVNVCAISDESATKSGRKWVILYYFSGVQLFLTTSPEK
jgi:hypothetical protein